MARATPGVRFGTLVYQQDGQEYLLAVGTASWYTWLGAASTFAFTGEYGTFTARKEQVGKNRRGWYWKAYRKRDGRVYRAYLGKSENLTLQRSNAIAAVLAGRELANAEPSTSGRDTPDVAAPTPGNEQSRFLDASPMGVSKQAAHVVTIGATIH